jgi:hypothetical protein
MISDVSMSSARMMGRYEIHLRVIVLNIERDRKNLVNSMKHQEMHLNLNKISDYENTDIIIFRCFFATSVIVLQAKYGGPQLEWSARQGCS